jgi:hypothetical protein
MNLPANPNADVRKLNPHLYGPTYKTVKTVLTNSEGLEVVEAKRRVRQDSKPLMNKLESDYFCRLKILGYDGWPVMNLRAQSVRYRLANGVWYKPDMTCNVIINGTVIPYAFECKGPRGMKSQDRGFLVLKMAASQFAEMGWVLAWCENGEWKEQRILA